MYEISFSFSAPSRAAGYPVCRPMNRKSRTVWYRSAISRIAPSSSSARRTCEGSSRMRSTIVPISSGNIVRRTCARYRASRSMATICVANVFVAATPISGPASVSVFRSRTGSRYRNSLAISISTGSRVQCSIAYFATSPAWYAVPHATTNTLSTDRMASSLILSSSSRWTPPRVRPRHDPSRPREERRRVGGQERLTVAEPHHHRRGHPDAHDRPGLVSRQDHERVRALEPGHGGPHGVGEIGAVADGVLDQVGHHFGVGLRPKHMPVQLEPLPELMEVLDDAVVDDGDPAVAVEVWVRVLVGRRPVGGPPRVAHADRPLRGSVVRELLLQGLELPGALHDGEVAVEHGHPGRVVATVFETMEPLEDDGERLVGTNVTDNPAHEDRNVTRTAPRSFGSGRGSLGTDGVVAEDEGALDREVRQRHDTGPPVAVPIERGDPGCGFRIETKTLQSDKLPRVRGPLRARPHRLRRNGGRHDAGSQNDARNQPDQDPYSPHGLLLPVAALHRRRGGDPEAREVPHPLVILGLLVSCARYVRWRSALSRSRSQPRTPRAASSVRSDPPQAGRIEAEMASAWDRASSSVSASTITLTTGSVPEGRTRTRPRSRSASSAPRIASATSGEDIAPAGSSTATFSSTWGNRRMAEASSATETRRRAASVRNRTAAGRLAKDTVVVTVMANLGLRQALESAGVTVLETQVGDRYVLEEMRRVRHH